MFSKKIIFLAAIFLIIAAFAALFIVNSQNESDLGYQLKKRGFLITNTGSFQIKSIDSGDSLSEGENISAESNDEILKIKILENFSKEKAEEYKNNQSALFEGLFNPQLPPYPEFLTNKTECAKEFLPVKKMAESGDYYLTFANERFGYGICAQDLVKYKAGFGMFYCENSKKLFKIQYFIDNVKIKNFKNIEDFFGTFQCGK